MCHLPADVSFDTEVALQLAQIPLELPNYGNQPLTETIAAAGLAGSQSNLPAAHQAHCRPIY